MSKSLKDAESLHTDHHDANIISPVVATVEITHKMSQQREYQKI